jgi:predicted SAM-dependent methyltransferase
VENLKNTIKVLNSLLQPEGRIVVAVPNYKSYDAEFYKEHWAAYDVPRHLWHFSQKAIHKLFLEVEMIVEETLPMKFDSYYVSLLSEKYKTGKSNPAKAFYRGFLSNISAKSTSEYSSLIYVIKND